MSELAEQADCAIETIRFYERAGLLPKPRRTSGNCRMYDSKHVERVLFIRHCRYLDMTLDKIRQLLKFCDAPRESGHEVNTLLDEHITHVGERVVELQTLQRRLKELRRLCQQASAARDCGILQELASSAGPSAAKRPRRGHVHGTHNRVHRRQGG